MAYQVMDLVPTKKAHPGGSNKSKLIKIK